jgi:xylulokinase
MEGITFGLRDSVEIMKEINLPLGKKFIASGGGGKSNFWCQMMADIFQKNIARLISQEGAPFGAAILSGVGTGIYEDVKKACKTILKEKDVFEFNLNNSKLYEKFYKIYKELYFQLKNSFDNLAKIL